MLELGYILGCHNFLLLLMEMDGLNHVVALRGGLHFIFGFQPKIDDDSHLLELLLH
jgi:hypothetical protein